MVFTDAATSAKKKPVNNFQVRLQQQNVFVSSAVVDVWLAINRIAATLRVTSGFASKVVYK